MSNTEVVSPKLKDQVVALIEREFHARIDATCPELYEHQERSKVKNAIAAQLTTAKAVTEAETALNRAREAMAKELQQLAPKGMKLFGDFDDMLDMLTTESIARTKKSRIELRQECHKAVARARMAKTQDQLEKILKDLELV